ncbi:hypothetical protein PCK1_001686 [Pneumocystis canis]|nr:hypothetical protein PCK1_001686 [Pneumocystis canis]
MNRLFGLKTRIPIHKKLNDVTDERIEKCEKKLYECEIALKKLGQLRNNKNVENTGLKLKAQMLLRQRKIYQEQLEMLQGQQMNIEQIAWTTEQVKMSQEIMTTMKHAEKELKQYPLQLNKIEQLHNTIEDSLIQVDEIQRTLARPYNMNEFDEFELDAELDALGELNEQINNDKQSEIPDYLITPTALNILNTLPTPSNSIKSNQEDAQAAT